MTDASHFSVLTRYEMALLERLQQFEVTPDVLADMVGLPLERHENFVPAEVFDTDHIHEIALYLIDIEELGGQFDSSEGDEVVNIGMFIYGFTKNYPELER